MVCILHIAVAQRAVYAACGPITFQTPVHIGSRWAASTEVVPVSRSVSRIVYETAEHCITAHISVTQKKKSPAVFFHLPEKRGGGVGGGVEDICAPVAVHCKSVQCN